VAELLGAVGEQHDPQELLARLADLLERAGASAFSELCVGSTWSLHVVASDQDGVEPGGEVEAGVPLRRTRSGARMVCPPAHARNALLFVPIDPTSVQNAAAAVEALLQWEPIDSSACAVSWKRELLRQLPLNLFFLNEANRGSNGASGTPGFDLEVEIDLSHYIARSAEAVATDASASADVKREADGRRAAALLADVVTLTPSEREAARAGGDFLAEARGGLLHTADAPVAVCSQGRISSRQRGGPRGRAGPGGGGGS
jgi:hypothetical protein